MRKRAASIAGALGVALGLFGCSTHLISLDYPIEPVSWPASLRGTTFKVGDFVDRRDSDPDWLGAIRGDFGEPLKTLRTKEPVSEILEQAFGEALRARGVLATQGGADFELRGAIERWEAVQRIRRRATIAIEVEIVPLQNAGSPFRATYEDEEFEQPFGAGILGSPEGLRALTERVLRSTIDRVLADPDLRAAIEPAEAAGEARAQDRLRQLEDLREQGLIDEEDWVRKRKEILDAL